MSAGGRLGLALLVALLLHGLALAAAASWLPARPTSPPRLTAWSVADAGPGVPAEAAWRLRADGPMASRAAVLRVEARPVQGEDTVVQEFAIAPVPGGLTGGGAAALDLPAGAAGPWTARATVVTGDEPAGPPREASFWVDDGRVGDLTVEGLDAGGTVAAAGGALRLSWRRVNRGAGWLRGGGVDAATLTAGGEEVAAGSLAGFGPLPPGGQSAHTLTLALPESFAGVATLRLEADAGRALAEPHGPENQQTLPLLVEPSPHPDLAAVRLDVGAAATLREDAPAPRRTVGEPVAVLAGSPVPVRLIAENLHAAATPLGDSRRDAVFLSRDAVLDAGDLPLVSVDRPDPVPGRARDASTGEVTVPEDWAGPGDAPATAFLIGVVDADGALDEGDPARRRNNALAVEVAVRRPSAEPDDTPLGEDEAEPVTTVAWIPHEAFEEVLARKRRTLQPAAQASAAPSPDAPLRDATAPPVPPRPPSPPEAVPAEEQAPAAPPPPASGDAAAPGEALPAPGPAEAPAPEPDPRTVARNEPEAPRSADPAAEPSETPASPPTPPPAPEGLVQPTSAPRSPSEADPTADADATQVRPGRVEVGPGLRVDVARPRIDPVAVISTVIHPPRVAVTFDTDGTVLLAQVLRSAGSNAVDAPILRSLYRWKASGERLKTWDGPKTFEFTFLFDR